MPINFPSRKEVIDRIKSDVLAEVPDSDPFLRNSYIQALMVAFGGRIKEVYLKMEEELKQLFPDSATLVDFISRWGNIRNVFYNTASISTGYAVAFGTLGSIIPSGTQVLALSGGEYTSQVSATIAVNSNSITSLTFSSGTVTAITSGNHNYASGVAVTISGATPNDYNGTFTIFVTSLNSFTYEISTSPTSPATGSPNAMANTALILFNSDDFGAINNVASGTALTLATPLSGVNSTLYVNFGGFTGGTDDETIEDYKTRVENEWQNPNTPFNAPEIKNIAQSISGVTRVWVEEPDSTTGTKTISSITQSGNVATITFSTAHNLISGMYISVSGANQSGYNIQNTVILVLDSTHVVYIVSGNPTSPATGTLVAAYTAIEPGQTRVLFTRDNDLNIIPSSADVANVKTALLTIKPAHMTTDDLIVLAPTAVPVAFIFTSLTPNTTTMQAAITANLTAFFKSDDVAVGTTLLQKAYTKAIFGTIDPETGEVLENYTLSAPAGDVTIQSGQLATLDTVSYP